VLHRRCSRSWCAFFVCWVVADPSFEETASQSEWSYVPAFSGLILLLAIAVPTLAQLAGGVSWAPRV